MQLGFYFDQSRCIGCYACIIACKDWHDLQDNKTNWIDLQVIEDGKFPDISVNFLLNHCYHCAEPKCIPSCPVNAITKRAEDGIVVIDPDKCIGNDNCDQCQKACPYHIPTFSSEVNAKAQKCNFCLDRLSQGRRPSCVEACPVNALDVGPVHELESVYGNDRLAVGFNYFENNRPSLIFKKPG